MRTEIAWSDAAWSHYNEVLKQCGRIEAYFGKALADEHRAEFLGALCRVTFAAGPVSISKDHTGFLIVRQDGFTVGLVFTPDSLSTMRNRTNLPDDEYRDEALRQMPRTGRWSAHS